MGFFKLKLQRESEYRQLAINLTHLMTIVRVGSVRGSPEIVIL
jgi:hypothetical protein